jgi:hypothetical protein
VSTDNTTTEDLVIYATLVRGRCYFLGDREFLFEEEQIISQDDRDWLEVHAVDQVTVEDEGEHQARQKFKFELRPRDAGDKAAKAASSPRQRSR